MDRVYQCKKCDAKGTLESGGFTTKIVGQKTPVRVVRHECGGNTKWLPGEHYFVPEANGFLDEVEEVHGIFMGSYVKVDGLEDQGQMKVIGIKRGTRRKIRVDVWNPDTKYSWNVPIRNIKEVWNANEG